ncbi:MAG: DUF4124 domain-containing protein [Methylotenera sp.]
MKHLLIVSTCLLSFQAHAEIFVCKDSSGRITYQQKPCLTTATVGTLKNIPDAPIEDQILARDRINKANEVYRQSVAKAEIERQQQEDRDRALEAMEIERRKLELLERQTIAAEKAAMAPRWSVGVRGVQRPGFHHRIGSPRFEKGSHRPRSNSGADISIEKKIVVNSVPSNNAIK